MLKRVSLALTATLCIGTVLDIKAQEDCSPITKNLQLYCEKHPVDQTVNEKEQLDPNKPQEDWFQLDINLTFSCGDNSVYGETFFAYGDYQSKEKNEAGLYSLKNKKRYEKAKISGRIKNVIPEETPGKNLPKAIRKSKNAIVVMEQSSLYKFKGHTKDSEFYLQKILITLSKKKSQRTVTLELRDFKEVEKDGIIEYIPITTNRTWSNCEPFPDLSPYYYFNRSS